MIEFTCPSCGTPYRVKSEFSGKKTICKACSSSIVVPTIADLATQITTAQIVEPEILEAEIVRRPDSKSKAYHKGSISQNSPGLSPNLLRLAIHRKNYLLFALVVAVMSLIAICLSVYFFNNNQAFVGWPLAIVGSLMGLVGMIALLVFFAALKSDYLAISKGLLTPAVSAPDHSKMYTLASLGNGSRSTYYGVQELECKPLEGETEIPCASVFMAGNQQDRWARYDSIPLRAGSSEIQAIAACHSCIERELWEALHRIVRTHEIPGYGKMLLLDGSFKLIGIVSTRMLDQED